jgi:hypothetical protein
MNLDVANAALRFVLELAALAALAYWGWTTHTGLLRVGWAVGLPLVAALVWGLFRVPDDPSHNPEHVPVPVTGVARLLLEVTLFAAALGLLAEVGQETAAAVLSGLVAIHYLLDRDRVRWLLERTPDPE